MTVLIFEEVLIVRVEGWINEEQVYQRFEHLNNFERMLQDNNTHILKFYLHVSEEEQSRRFYERIANPKKQWKYGPEDFDKAKKWPAYRKAYEAVFEHCSPEIPWHIVPSDNNWYKEYYIAKTVVEKMRSLNMSYPKGDINMENPDVIALMSKMKIEGQA